MKKIIIITSHPIQYQVPLFKLLTLKEEMDLRVHFCWDFGVGGNNKDKEFGRIIEWDIPLFDGYRYKFLKNYSLKPSSDFWGQINFSVISELRKERPDALLIFGWNSFTNWLAFFTAFSLGIKVFLRGESPLNQELLKPKWKIGIKKFILKPLFSRVYKLLYIGYENKKFYEYYGVPEEKLVFVPYAVDNKRFMAVSESLKANRKELREKLLGIKDERPVILFVGKLISKKRPMDLLRAYELLIISAQGARLPDGQGSASGGKYQQLKTNNYSLVFVGDGELRSELEKYAKEHDLKNVHFAGFKNQTELPQYYTVADMFVLPSGPGETWGLVVNEAMCFGLPVVVSDIVGCVTDLVYEGENGYVVPLGDVRKLSDALSMLLKNDREKFGKKSFEIIQGYSFEEESKNILSIVNI